MAYLENLLQHIQENILLGEGIIYLGKTYSSKNSKTFSAKTGKLYKRKATILAENEMLRQFNIQKPHIKLPPPKHLHFFFSFGDKRRRDLPNMVQGIMDALVKAGIYEDDNYNYLIPKHYIPIEGKKTYAVMLYNLDLNKLLKIDTIVPLKLPEKDNQDDN